MPKFNTITVGELRDALVDLADEWGEDTPIAFSSDYGDHGHTQQLHRLRGEADLRPIEESGYSISGFAVREAHEDDEETDAPVDIPQILILR